jgi:hypothetical protein
MLRIPASQQVMEDLARAFITKLEQRAARA